MSIEKEVYKFGVDRIKECIEIVKQAPDKPTALTHLKEFLQLSLKNNP